MPQPSNLRRKLEWTTAKVPSPNHDFNQPNSVVKDLHGQRNDLTADCPLRPLERRSQIKRRLDEIKMQRHALSTEEQELFRENNNLAVAEHALKQLLERKP